MSKKSADLYIDGYIGKSISGGFFGSEPAFGLKELNEFLGGLDKDVDHINVHINSGGGSVDEGFAIHDKLASVPYSITTIGEGMVGSIATVVYLSGATRKIFKNSKFFIHNPYVPFTEGLESKDAQKLADELKAEEERILNFYSDKTGKTTEEIKPYMDAQTAFNSQKALDMGFVTEIIEKDSVNMKEYKLVALIKNQNLKNETMDKKEQLNWFQKLEAKLNKALKMEVKAEMTKTSEGVEVWFEGDLQVGTKIWLDESMTKPAPDGVHTIGLFKATVKEGAVTNIEEVAPSGDADAEALKAEIATLKENLEAEKKKVTELEASKKESEKVMTETLAELKEMKNTLIGEPAPKTDKQSFPKSKPEGHKLDGLKNGIVKKYGNRKF